MNFEVMKLVRDNIEMGSVLSFTEVMIIQQAIDAAMLQGAERVTTTYKLPEPIKDNRLNSGPEADDYYAGYQAGWNELLESVSGNSPVIPDGWVACSERMPEDEQEVITHNIFGYRHVSFFDEHSGHFFDRLDGSPVDCVEHVLVSHWMPLPAAPQHK